MKSEFWFSALTVAAVAISGCGPSSSAPAPTEKLAAASAAKAPAADADHDHDQHSAGEKTGHDHSGWWCNEHGVPEEVCAQCNSKLAAEFQKKGDWCKEHERPESQCFKCQPKLQAKFAAQYVAKFGKQPPEPDMN